MAKSFVRESAYRHVFCEELVKEAFSDLRISSKASETNCIRVNKNYIAFATDSGGGSSLAVLDRFKPGRQKPDIPLVSGHRSAILDFEWHPFYDDMLLTTGEDLSFKLWKIPEGGLKEHLKEPVWAMEGAHEKKIGFATWNKSVNNIFATNCFGKETKVWNVESQAEFCSMPMDEQVWSMKWSYKGDLLAIAEKTKKVRIFDPRQKNVAMENQCHDGAKACKVEWMGRPGEDDESSMLITTGFSPQAERQVMVHDLRTWSSGGRADELMLMVQDTGTGALYPFYDAGTSLLFAPGKGDSNCRYFELTPKEAPYIHFITSHGGKESQKGYDFLPKQHCDTTKHEVMRGYRLQANNMIMPLSFRVPRKSVEFQEDIFPDAPALPSQGGDAWAAGGEAKGPKTVSMRPGAGGASSVAAAPVIVNVKELKAQLEAANKRIEELEKENAELKAKLEGK